MNPLSIGLIVFACVFGGALFGMFLGTVLPKEHLSADASDVIKVSMAMVATLAALVLGLLTASAKSSLDDKEGELRAAAAQVILLDRTMAEYGPETAQARDLLKQILVARIDQIWPEESEARGDPGGDQSRKRDRSRPGGASRSFAEERCAALASIDRAADHPGHRLERWTVVEQLGSSLQWPFLVVVVFWLAIIFASFGLFAPRNASVNGSALRRRAVGSRFDLSDP